MKLRFKILYSLSLPALICAQAIQAGEKEIKPTKSIDLSGTLDLYYLYNFNRPRIPIPSGAQLGALSTPAPANNSLHYFDFYHNQFSLSLAELSILAKKSDVNLLLDLDFGATTDFVHGAPAATDEVSKHIGQAIITYQPSEFPRLHLIAGKMATHVGWETLKAKDNWQYSRSVTYAYGMPFWQTGVGLGYDIVPDSLSTTIYILNGWNNLTDNNSGKTAGAQVKWTPRSDTTLIYNLIWGPEQNRNNSNYRQVHESNLAFNATDSLSFAGEGLIGFEELYGGKTATWQGATLATKYQIFSNYAVSGRAEFYRDVDGFTIQGAYQALAPSEKYMGVTLTNLIRLSEFLEARAEIRFDRSNQSQRFESQDGFSRNQTTVGISLIGVF